MKKDMVKTWGSQMTQVNMALELFCRPQGVTNEELEQELEVSRSTAFRIKKTLERSVPVVEDGERDGRTCFKVLPSYVNKLPNMTTPKLSLDKDEIQALYFLRSHASLFDGTDIGRKIASAYTKMEACLPTAVLPLLRKAKNLCLSTRKLAKEYKGKAKEIEILTTAIIHQQTCTVTYNSFSADTVKTYDINPLHFFERDGGLYLFVALQGINKPFPLAVERIKKLSLTSKSFTPPKGFDPDKLLDYAFGVTFNDPIQVKIRFSKDQAKYIKERRWTKKQKITNNPDGTIILEMDTSGWWEVMRWVLSFGADAEVLEPLELREEIRKGISQMDQVYRKS
jgi:predicted DNA-binding transcriptional regulator YafY